MMKTGRWYVNFELMLEGEEVRWDDLSEATQDHILDMIREDYVSGEIVEEIDYNGKTFPCPECGEEVTVDCDTARCEACGWMAADADLDEILEG